MRSFWRLCNVSSRWIWRVLFHWKSCSDSSRGRHSTHSSADLWDYSIRPSTGRGKILESHDVATGATREEIYALDPYFRLCRAEVVGQSMMQLICCDTTRNLREIWLQSSLLNCDSTLQVLQHVSTRCNQQLHCNDVCVCFYYLNNTQVQTATFQSNGLGSVRLYVKNTWTLKYNLDIHILTWTPASGRLMLHWHST